MLNNIWRNEKIWRMLTNLWTAALVIFLLLNFFSKNRYDYFTPALSIIYTGVLSIYAGTKEFDRWYESHQSRHPGEWFIIGWTALLLIFFLMRLWLGNEYKISSEIIADYIMVLSIFAITQKSKRLHQQKRKASGA